jgi:hypothetical protein
VRRKASVLLPLAAAGIVAFLFLEAEEGRARGPVARRATASRVDAETFASAPSEEPAAEAETVTLAGTVRDGRGQPFVGATVRLFAGGHEPGSWSDAPPRLADPASVATTDRHGRLLSPRGTTRHGRWPRTRPLRARSPARARGVESGDGALALLRGVSHRLRVVDGEERPLPDAEALVFQRGEVLRTSVHADAEGWIEACLAPQELLLVRAPGCAWELVEPPLPEPLVMLDREYRLGGVVVTAGGRPVPGVRLAFERYLWQEEHVTGDDGRFLFRGLGSAVVELAVTPPGGETRNETGQPGDEGIRIVVGTGRIEGLVVLPDGAPATGAGLRVVDWSDFTGHASDGNFVIKDVPSGEVTLRGFLHEQERWGDWPDYEGFLKVAVPDGGVARVRLVLERCPASFVTVVAVGPDGAALTGRLDAAARLADGSRCTRRADPDGPGRRLLNIAQPPGARVWVSCETQEQPCLGGALWAVTRATREGPDTVVELKAPTEVTIVCREADGSEVPAGFEAAVRSGDTGATPVGPGRYRLKVPVPTRPPDTWQAALNVDANGYAPLRIVPWGPPAQGAEVEVRLRRAVPITGRILEPDGTPTSRAYVQLDEGVPSRRREHFQYPDREGRFVLDGAPDEVVVLVVSKGGVPGSVQRIEVPHAGALDLGDIVLEPPWIARGVVVDGDGAPVGGALLTVLCPGQDGKGVSRGDGTFVLEAPPWEGALIEVSKEGLAADPVPVASLRGEPQTIRLRPAATLVIDHVARIDDLWVHRPQSGIRWRWPSLALPPGRLVVEVHAAGKTTTHEVNLEPLGTTRIALDR